jgi:hypothetical protein
MCGGSTKQKQSSTSTFTPNSLAMGSFTDVLNRATDAANTEYNPAMDKTVAGFTPDQLASFGGVNANQGAWQGSLADAEGMIGDAGAAVTGQDISQYMNPYQSQVIDAAMAKIRDQDAMQNRQFMANEVSQGGLGGNGVWLGKAELQGRQGDNRNAQIANMLSQGFNTSLGAAQTDKARGLQAGQSLATTGQMKSALGYTDAQALNASGNQQQAQQQAVNDAASGNAQAQTLWDPQMAQYLASISSAVGPLMGGTTTSTGTSTTKQGMGLGQIIGAGATLAGMASDERVKDMGPRIGWSDDGQPIYKFRYKGDPRTQIGFKAQDVERSHPEAVTDVAGVKHVNYDRATPEYADGGGVGLGSFKTMMPWAQLNPGRSTVPEPMRFSSPEGGGQGGGQSPEDAFKMGQKAGQGLQNLWNKSDGAGGWGASIVPTSSLGSGGGGFSLGSLFGFADGGVIEDEDPYRAAAMRLRDRVIQQESGGRDDVVSSAGARGRMQVMPATGQDPGYGVRPLANDTPEENARFGTDYLTAMIREFKGDEEAALIAYNGGPKRAQTWLANNRDDSVIPAESANYYRSIKGMGTPKATSEGVSPAVQKGYAQPGTVDTAQPYKNSADRATGGLLKRVFGIDFNPLNLSETERRALIVAGASMMSNGNVGQGIGAGMQYITGVEAGERDARSEAAKLQRELNKDKQAQSNWEAEFGTKKDAAALEREKYGTDTALRKDAATLDKLKFETETGFKKDQSRLEGDKFKYTQRKDETDAAFNERKLTAELGKPTDDLKEYDAYAAQEEAAGRKPLSQIEYLTQLKAAGRSQTNVNVSGDKKGAEEMAKRYAEEYFNIRKNADGAQTLLDNLDSLERGLQTEIRTGAFADVEQGLRKMAVAVGISPEDARRVAGGELVESISNKLALQVRAPGGESGGMPGAMSDADRSFLKDTVPGLLKTPGGNQQIVAIMRAAAQRHQVIHDMAISYAEDHDGQLGPGFDRQVRDYVKANPLSNSIKALDPDKPVSVKSQTIQVPRLKFDMETGAFQ